MAQTLTAQVFRTTCAEKIFESVDDIQHRYIPELKEGQLARRLGFSSARALRDVERLMNQWGSPKNLCHFVLSDLTGIVTLAGEQFGGMFYQSVGDSVYATPEINEAFESRDGTWAAVVRYEHAANPPYDTYDFVIELTETVNAVSRIWVFKVEDIAKGDPEHEAIPGESAIINTKLTGKIYLNDVEVGDGEFIPIHDELIYEVPERYNVQDIDSPEIDDGIVHGLYRSAGMQVVKRRRLGGSTTDKQHILIQILRRWYNNDSDYTKIGTNWRIRNDAAFHSGSSQIILELPNVDPSKAREITEALPVSPATFTNTIHTTTDGLLEGTWTNKNATFEISDDGSATILWLLSLHNNDDFWFTYKNKKDETAINFYKTGAVTTSKDDFFENYYFEPTGDWYYSTAGTPGVGAYTKKNGVDATGILPVDSARLGDEQDNRVTLVSADFSDERDEWFITARIVYSNEDDSFLFNTIDNRVSYQQSKTTSISKEWGYGLSKTTIVAVKDKYDDAALNGEIRRLEVVKNKDNGTYDFIGVIILKTGVSSSISLGNKIFYIGVQEDEEPTALSLGISVTANVNGAINYNVDDDTWSWSIVESLTREIDGERPGGESMITYGEPLEIIKEWQYAGKTTLPNGGVPDIGSYESDGKSMTRTKYDVSINTQDSTYSWKKTETTITVPLGSHPMGGNSFVERDHRLMRNWAMDGLGDAWKTSTVDSPLANMLALYWAQISRYRGVDTASERYFYVQQPTGAMLSADGIDPSPTPVASERHDVRIAQHGKYLFSATDTVTFFETWTPDFGGASDSELIAWDDLFMTKTIWDSANDNPEYSASYYPTRGRQQP